MADEKSNEQKPMSREQKAVVAKVAKLMPNARVFEPKTDRNSTYYGPVLFADKKFVVQQVGDTTVVAHPRTGIEQAQDGQAVEPKDGVVINVAYDKEKGVAVMEAAPAERWAERAARTPANEAHAEIARSHLGPNVGVFNPPASDHGMSPRYEGVIVAVDESNLIQRINSRTAIVHAVPADVARKFGPGEEVAVSYLDGKFLSAETIERTQQQEQKAEQAKSAPERSDVSRDPDDASRAKSFVMARNMTLSVYGRDNKLYSAERVDAKAGKFTGPLVAVTDHHAIQRVGQNNFIVHKRENLQGEITAGKFVQVAYTDGKAQVQAAERRADRQREAQQPQQQRREQGRSQGMSR